MADLNNRTISKLWPVDGKKKKFRGLVTYLGKKEEPYCYKITYEDDEETMTREEVEKVLLSEKSVTAPKVQKVKAKASGKVQKVKAKASGKVQKVKAKASTKVQKVKAKAPAKKKKAVEQPDIDEEYWDDAEAEACDGIIIKKLWPIPGNETKSKFYPGKVTYLRSEGRPYCFQVAYEEDEETMCLHEVLTLKGGASKKKSKAKKASNPLSVKKVVPTKKVAAKKKQ